MPSARRGPPSACAPLAGRRGRLFGKRAALLEQVPDPVLRRRVHLPLRVVDAHLAGPARLRLQSLLHREQVTRVAGVARREAEHPSFRPHPLDLVLGLEAQPVATSAALHPLGQGHGQPVCSRHRVHARPRLRVLASGELLDLDRMAGRAHVRRGGADEVGVARTAMPITVAEGAIHALGAVETELLVDHDRRRLLAMAVDACRCLSERVRRASAARRD